MEERQDCVATPGGLEVTLASLGIEEVEIRVNGQTVLTQTVKE
jgi:preprotein translocase subunit YajC